MERLIVEEGVNTFLFGSRSKFDELCHIVVTELKEKYPNILRVAYLCKHETVCLVGAGTSLSQKIKDLIGRNGLVLEFEEIKKSERVNSARRASYLKRNYWMIDESCCVAYFLRDMQKKSGTQIAYLYATKEGKILVSLVCFSSI